jgi:hypothetical protein
MVWSVGARSADSVAAFASWVAGEIARATAAEGANLQEAKDYADARVQGLSFKTSVDYAYPRTGAYTLPAQASALIAADGLAVGNRVLVYSADQSAHIDNGIYVVQGTSFVRAADMAAAADAAGAVVYVERATDAGATPGTSFVCSNAGTATVGTDALQFVIFSRMENLSFSSGTQKNGTAVSLKIEAAKPVFVNGSNELSFRITGPDLSIDGSGNLKVDGALVGGEFVPADAKHSHEAVSVVFASANFLMMASASRISPVEPSITVLVGAGAPSGRTRSFTDTALASSLPSGPSMCPDSSRTAPWTMATYSLVTNPVCHSRLSSSEASGVLPKTITPLVSRSSRWTICGSACGKNNVTIFFSWD